MTALPPTTSTTTKGNVMTGIEIVQQVARDRGRSVVSPEEVEHILWEHTGFPGFFDGVPSEVLTRQVNEYFERS